MVHTMDRGIFAVLPAGGWWIYCPTELLRPCLMPWLPPVRPVLAYPWWWPAAGGYGPIEGFAREGVPGQAGAGAPGTVGAGAPGAAGAAPAGSLPGQVTLGGQVQPLVPGRGQVLTAPVGPLGRLGTTTGQFAGPGVPTPFLPGPGVPGAPISGRAGAGVGLGTAGGPAPPANVGGPGL